MIITLTFQYRIGGLKGDSVEINFEDFDLDDLEEQFEFPFQSKVQSKEIIHLRRIKKSFVRVEKDYDKNTSKSIVEGVVVEHKFVITSEDDEHALETLKETLRELYYWLYKDWKGKDSGEFYLKFGGDFDGVKE